MKIHRAISAILVLFALIITAPVLAATPSGSIAVNVEGSFTIEGDIDQQTRTGTGILRYPYTREFPFQIDHFTGELDISYYSLQRVFTLNDNKVYKGDVVEGLPHGTGIINGHSYKYEGEWKNGMFDGKGLFIIDRFIDPLEYGYYGDWVKGVREGLGEERFIWSYFIEKDNPDKYHLLYQEDVELESEYFTMRFIGPFSNDRAHGKGECYINKLPAQACEYKKGILQTKIKLDNNLIIEVTAVDIAEKNIRNKEYQRKVCKLLNSRKHRNLIQTYCSNTD